MYSTCLFCMHSLGGTGDEIPDAVERLDRAGDAERFLKEAARHGARLTGPASSGGKFDQHDDPVVDWGVRPAREEIESIADSLLLPSG